MSTERSNDEKDETRAVNVENSDLDAPGIIPDWTEAEERKVKRKLDFLLMPLLFLGFFVLQLDKSNIGNALTDNFTGDVGIGYNQVNTGNSLLQAGIVIFEIPFNIILQLLGAPIWITFQILAWGSISTFQAFITNEGSYYATRFLLGVFESAYSPGAMLLLAMFYKRDELALRTTILYVGNYFASGVGSLMAAGILQLRGVQGLAGWQWLFIIEGTFTMLIGIVFAFALPKNPLVTKGLLAPKAFDRFNDRERTIMNNRVILDDHHKKIPLHFVSFKDVLRHLINYRLWMHCIINVQAIAPKGALQTYSPTIIQKLGFSTTAANALNSVGAYGVIVVALTLAWLSDKTNLRGLWCIVSMIYCIVFAGVQYSVTDLGDDKKWAKYAVLMALNSGNAVSQSLNDAWLSCNARSPTERSVGLSLAVIGSNLGGLAGQQMFRAEDAPRYTTGFLAILLLYAGGLISVLIMIGVYVWSNKRLVRREEEHEGSPVGVGSKFRYGL